MIRELLRGLGRGLRLEDDGDRVLDINAISSEAWGELTNAEQQMLFLIVDYERGRFSLDVLRGRLAHLREVDRRMA